MVDLTASLMPLGLAVWIAFVIQMLFTNISFVGQSLSDPFGWGWNLLGLAGTRWTQLLPRLIPWLQVFTIIAGFAYSLRNLRRIWFVKTGNIQLSFRGFLPHSILLTIITIVFIFFYAN
jgi:hypothetical protein